MSKLLNCGGINTDGSKCTHQVRPWNRGKCGSSHKPPSLSKTPNNATLVGIAGQLTELSSCIQDDSHVGENVKLSSAALVSGGSVVSGETSVLDEAVVDGSRVTGKAVVFGTATVADGATVDQNAMIGGNAVVMGKNVVVNGNARVTGNSDIMGITRIGGNSEVDDHVTVIDSDVKDASHVRGHARIENQSSVNGRSLIEDDALITKSTVSNGQVRGTAKVENSKVDTATVSGDANVYKALIGPQGDVRSSSDYYKVKPEESWENSYTMYRCDEAYRAEKNCSSGALIAGPQWTGTFEELERTVTEDTLPADHADELRRLHDQGKDYLQQHTW